MNKYTKTILGILIVVIPALLLLSLLFNKLTKKSFYPDSGEVTVAGISSNVKIYSDDYGVPHIFSQNENDVYFAMGYMHARDRLWQMDISRRAAEGRLSEIFGNRTVKIDKLFRTIGIGKFSFDLYNHISSKSKEMLSYYSRGVNAFIKEHTDELPIEFDILNYKPDEWKPENSLMIVRMMGWELNLSWYTDYIIGEMINKIGLEKTSLIFPDTTIKLYKINLPVVDTSKSDSLKPLSNIPMVSRLQQAALLTKGFFDADECYRQFFNIDCTHMGSNCWVVSGRKSETGKPILANDPHLAFQAPSKWYEVHLHAGNLDVTGMSIPGVPGIAIGHNRNISWGLTNLMNDDNDFYEMDKDSIDANKYKYKNTFLSMDSLVERISVKDSSDIYYTTKYTVEGPVVSDLDPLKLIGSKENENIYKNKILAFRWTGFEYSDEVYAFYKINKAVDWEGFKEALKDFGVPAQNFTYADINGNIGYMAAGKIPIRKQESGHEYIYPSPPENDWSGNVEFDKLPTIYNPDSGYIVTANTDPFEWLKTPAKERYYISYTWEPPSRFQKINEILGSRTRFNVEEFKLMQMNNESPYAKNISFFLLSAFKNVNESDPDVISALDMFKNWNGDMNHDNPAGTIYSVFFVRLLKNLFYDALGEQLFHDFLLIPNLSFRTTYNLLAKDNIESIEWFKFINKNKNEVIRQSFTEALSLLKTKLNTSDQEQWHWGHIHKVIFRHLLGSVPALERTFNIGPYEVGGDQTTVNNAEYSFNRALENFEFDNILGPSMRMIVDLADISNSYTINSTGQSGQPLNSNYEDQTRLWLFGDYKVEPMNETEMLKDQYKLLTLVPVH
jgi:penicillin amidase